MHSTDFSLLQRNLYEIYQALHTPEAGRGSLPLIASEQTLTYEASWKGRWVQICQVIKDLVYRILRWPLESNRHATVCHTMNSLFNACVIQRGYKAHHSRVANWIKAICQRTPMVRQEVQVHYEEYLKSFFKEEDNPYLKEYRVAFSQFMRQNDLLKDSQIIASRHMITACSEATQVFWRLFLKSKDAPFMAPLKPFIKEQSSALGNKPLYHACKNAQHIVDLEGLLEEEIPIVPLSSLGKEMTKQHKIELKKWIDKLNAHKSKIPLKTFLNVLKELISIIQIAGVQSITLDKILVELDERGCQILKQDEIKHMRWRQQLKCGSVVFYGEKPLKLAKELGSKVANNAYRVFTLEDHPNWVVKIARNTLQLKIEAEKAREEKWHWGVRLANMIEPIDLSSNTIVPRLDKGGKSVVIEKLETSLKNYPWMSSCPILTKEEEERALVIANHVYVMQDQMAMPEGLSPEHLMFDSHGGLKAIRLFKKEPFNYNELEKFCLSIGNGKAYITDFIMHISQLTHHPVANFYREGVEYALQYGETNNLSRVQNRQFKRDIYEKRLEELCKQAIELRSACVNFIRDHLLAQKEYAEIEGELEQKVYDRLVQIYHSSSTPGILNPEAVMQQVLQHFLDKHTESPYKGSSELMSYYDRLFQRMKKYNLEAAIG